MGRPGLRIGHLSTFYHTAVILMARKDTSERLGADVEWRLFGTGPAIVEAFGRGEIDLAYIGLPPAIIGIARGISIRCVAGGHIEGTVISGKRALRGFPEVKDLAGVLQGLRGERVGVPGKGSIHDVILRESLKRYGLGGEIAVLNFPWADQVTEAFVRGEVSAAVGTPALAVSLSRFSDGKVLLPPSMLWPSNPSYGILADTRMIREDRDVLERFLLLHEESAALLRARPAEAARLIAGLVGIVDEGFVLDTIRISPKYCAALTSAYIASTMKFVGPLRKLGYIGRDVGEEEIFDASLIARVHPEAGHYEIR